MRNTTIETLRLTNFKGIRDLEINFNGSITSILGKNGSGKTTIFDAFTWLLFGKDSEDRKVFDLKTLDSSGVAIPKLPHEVFAVLNVDGATITLCRRYKEKWVKRRGSADDEFTGHEEERLYNDVPLQLKEWSDKINEICPEQVFKFITNPLYFCTQKAEVQRAMLIRMAGDINDEAVAFGNDDFQRLLAQMTGKSMDEYKREIAAKKRTIKADIEGIPERIDECKRMMPEAENWDELETQLENNRKSLDDAEGQLSDKAKAYTAASNERMNLSKQLSDVKQKAQNRSFDVRDQVQSDYNTKRNKQQELTSKVGRLETERKYIVSDIETMERNLETLNSERENLINEWKEINGRQLTFNDNEFICPTCGRQFDIDEIERRQDDMTSKFNSRKSADLVTNSAKGQANKKKISDTKDIIESKKKRIAEIDQEIETIKSDELYSLNLVAPDATEAINNDELYKRFNQEVSELEAKLNEPLQMPDTEELKKQKADAQANISDLNRRLDKRETINRTAKRIEELETQLRNQNNELAKYEGIEFTMAKFTKARIEMVESRINGMFTMVKFKMFEQQINGGEVETCEAMVGGVPYSVLNNAGRINAGLDIINAICRFEGVTAPIFIDNAEAVNQIMHTDSQMIRLVVTEDERLIIQ